MHTHNVYSSVDYAILQKLISREKEYKLKEHFSKLVLHFYRVEETEEIYCSQSKNKLCDNLMGYFGFH